VTGHPVGEDGHPRRHHGAAGEFEVHAPGAVLEQAPARPEQDRGNQDPALVNEAVLQQALREALASVHDQVLAVLVLEPGDARRDVAADQVGVLPLQVRERGRRDVLGHAVDLVDVAELSSSRGPDGGEDLVRLAAQEQAIAVRQEVVVISGYGVVVVGGRPVLEVVHPPVERRVRRNDHFPHRCLVSGAGLDSYDKADTARPGKGAATGRPFPYDV
jgi:hypothetical protein